MYLLRGWKVRYIFQIGLYVWTIWLLSIQLVGALECYQCQLLVNVSVPDSDPCFDPKKSGAQTILCPNYPNAPAEALACYKIHVKNDTDSDYPTLVDRGCRYAMRNESKCDLSEKLSHCICNDRDLCNDEIGLEVAENNYNFSGSRLDLYSFAVSEHFRLPHTVLSLLSGCFGIVSKLSLHIINHGY